MMRTTHGTGSQRESSGYTVRLAMVAVVAVTIAMPSLSAAQGPPDTPTATFRELPLLVSLGDRITVTDDTGRELQGELIDLSPSALSVLVDERHDLQETDSAGKTWCPNGWRCSIAQTDAALRLAGNRDYWDHAAACGLAQGRGTAWVHLGRSHHIGPGAKLGMQCPPRRYASRYRSLWRPRGRHRRGRG